MDYRDYIEGTKQVLAQSQKEDKPYKVKVLERDFWVYPNVFSPKYFHDTELFAENIPIKEGEKILEIGAGTGAISITAIYKGANRVLAIDINPDAVKNTQANIQLHNMQGRVEIRQGNLYEAVKDGEKFDTIFWNTPFALIEDKEISDLEKAISDPCYKSTEKFIKEAHKYLKKDGRILIGFSTTLGKVELIEKFSAEANLSLKLIYEVGSKEIYPVKFEIFEAKQN